MIKTDNSQTKKKPIVNLYETPDNMRLMCAQLVESSQTHKVKCHSDGVTHLHFLADLLNGHRHSVNVVLQDHLGVLLLPKRRPTLTLGQIAGKVQLKLGRPGHDGTVGAVVEQRRPAAAKIHLLAASQWTEVTGAVPVVPVDGW